MKSNLKKVILVWFFIGLVGFNSIFAKEIYNYSVKVLSLPVLDLKMEVKSVKQSNERLEKVQFYANTNDFFDKIYSVKNQYKCVYDFDNYIPVMRSKIIKQPNLKTKVKARYSNNKVIYSNEKPISLPGNTYSLLSLLMLLREKDPSHLNNGSMYVEIDKTLYSVKFANTRDKTLKIGATKVSTQATEIKLKEESEYNPTKKDRKKDIFYGNVVKENGYRKIWIEKKPPHRIIKAKFSLGSTSLIAILKGVEN